MYPLASILRGKVTSKIITIIISTKSSKNQANKSQKMYSAFSLLIKLLSI